eukprot:Platyproteum_vivax@DN5373_c0_g1_i1.p1
MPFCCCKVRDADKENELTIVANEEETIKAPPRLTAEDKEKERKLLQEMVKEFAKEAIGGQDCFLVSPQGLVTKGQYCMDRKLHNLKLLDANGVEVISIFLGSVEDVGPLNQSQFFQTVAHAPLSQQQKNRMVCIELAPPDFCLLLSDSVERRDRFITCVKILRLYCITSTAT